MSTTCTPAAPSALDYTPGVLCPVDVTAVARAGGLRCGFRLVMTGDAYDRACARSEHLGTDEGVRVVVDALCWSLLALIEHERPLSVGRAWTIRTGHTVSTRWGVLVAADEADPAAVSLFLTPTA